MEGRDQGNFHPEEIRQFDQVGDAWWDPDGPQSGLHDINPLRLAYVCGQVARAAGAEKWQVEELVREWTALESAARIPTGAAQALGSGSQMRDTEASRPLDGIRALDVGCGGGLLTEGLARAGARALGVDLSESGLEAARRHAEKADTEVEYRLASSAEMLQEDSAGSWQLVTCMEVLEHVPDPARLVADCAALAAPGATLMFSTINRTPTAFALAILAAEYLLGIIPRGTHRYQQLVRPEELAGWCRDSGLEVAEIRGLAYNPLTSNARLRDSCDINYFLAARKPSSGHRHPEEAEGAQPAPGGANGASPTAAEGRGAISAAKPGAAGAAKGRGAKAGGGAGR